MTIIIISLALLIIALAFFLSSAYTNLGAAKKEAKESYETGKKEGMEIGWNACEAFYGLKKTTKQKSCDECTGCST